MSADPAAFRRQPLEPEVAAIAVVSNGDEPHVVVVNTQQPHANAINAIRTLIHRTMVGVPPLLHLLTEPLKRITVDQSVAAACGVIIAGVSGSSLLPNDPMTPPPHPPTYSTNQPAIHLTPTPRRAPRPRATPNPEPTQAVEQHHPTPPPTTTKRTPASTESSQSAAAVGPPGVSSPPTLSATPSPAGKPQPSPTGGLAVRATAGPLHIELELPVDLDPVLGLLNPH